MGREAIAKTNFNSGELSPRVLGRTDVDKYYNGTARMLNMLPLPFGGAQRTPGTMFVNEVRDSSKTARIIDWVFGSRQAYILQFNDSKIRFYKDRGVVSGSSGVVVTAITNANPGVVTAVAHGLSNGDRVTLESIDGMEEVNGIEYRVANKTADTFELTTPASVNVNTTSYGSFIPYSAVKLNCHFETDFTDSSLSAHTLTSVNSPSVTSDQFKFGIAAVAMASGTGYFTIPDSADWDVSGGVWTFDDWRNPVDLTTGGALFEQATDASNYMTLYFDTAGLLHFKIKAAGVFVVDISGGTVIAGQWNHFRICENGNNYYLFLNGVLVATTATASRPANYTGVFKLNTGTLSGPMNGYIDDTRWTNGYCRSTADFTVPSHQNFDANSVVGIYEISHTYDDDELFDIQTAQAQDIMYCAHPDNKPQKLSRFGDASWTIGDVDFQDGPYLDENTTTTTLNPSDVTGSVTVVASAITGINDDTGFQTTDVGRLLRYYDGTTWFWMKITARASTTSITATIQGAVNMANSDARTTWRLGAWSDTTGYPSAVAFFGGALWWAGTATQPQTCWRSVVFDYENMDEGAADAADALSVPVNSDTVNIVKWLFAGKRLVAGTEGENFTIWSGSPAATAITPANVKADPETNYGSAGIKPVKIGSYVYYVQDDKMTLREFYYDFSIDGYRSINKSILSDHITNGQIKQIAYQKTPFGIVYAVLDSGKLATLTREIEQEVTGWADQTTRAGDSYKSVAAIPVSGSDSSKPYTEVWFVISRVINGATKQYVEYQVNPRQDVESDLEDMVLMQSALTFQGSATVISGLEHLATEAVQVMVDGLEVTGKSVSAAGTLTLSSPSTAVVQIGLKNSSQLKLLPLEAGSQSGSSQGMLKKIGPVMARVYRSLGLKVGEDGGDMEDLLKDGNGVVSTTLQTDDFQCPSTLGWDAKQQLLFQNDTPYPTTLLMAVLYEYTAEENPGA